MVGEDLDWIQHILQDEGTLWPRAELLAEYMIAYRQFLTQSQVAKRFRAIDLPGRFTATGTYNWEQDYIQGTFWQWTFTTSNARYAASSLWEMQFLEGVTMQETGAAVTQQWERAFVTPGDQPYRFALPRDHTRIVKLWYNHQLLLPFTTKTFDAADRQWMSLEGEPVAWTQGVSKGRTYDLFEIVTGDHQGYALRGETSGIGRTHAGARTYKIGLLSSSAFVAYGYTATGEGQWGPTLPGAGWRFTQASTEAFTTFSWEKAWLEGETVLPESPACVTAPWERAYIADAIEEFPLGYARRIMSPDRQYLGYMASNGTGLYGVGRTWHTSAENLLLLEDIGPDVPVLHEDETPALLPPQLHKYLRYYVLMRVWSHQGEGLRPDLAGIAQRFYAHGESVAQGLTWLSVRDHNLRRETQAPPPERRRPGRPRLPSTYPSTR